MKKKPPRGVRHVDHVERVTIIDANALEPGIYTLEEHGFEGFCGDINGPEADAWFRKLSGGPEDVSGIPRANDDGWLIEPQGIPHDPGAYRPALPGRLVTTPIPAGMRWVLLSIGDTFRGPDHHHYQPIHGFARTRQRADELHWLSGLAPAELESTTSAVLFHPAGGGEPVISLYVGGPRWPHQR